VRARLDIGALQRVGGEQQATCATRSDQEHGDVGRPRDLHSKMLGDALAVRRRHSRRQITVLPEHMWLAARASEKDADKHR
jgi:hypothetical protein